MHLTRFEINPARRAARDLLASPQKLHAAVLAGFPTLATAPAGNGRVLWRLDQRDHQALLYIVSPHKPDLTHLVENVGWPTTHGWDTRDYTRLLHRLKAGDEWAFRLKANPVSSRRKSDDATRSQRFGHVTVSQQTDWLLTRTERHGFTIPAASTKSPTSPSADANTSSSNAKDSPSPSLPPCSRAAWKSSTRMRCGTASPTASATERPTAAGCSPSRR